MFGVRPPFKLRGGSAASIERTVHTAGYGRLVLADRDSARVCELVDV